MIKSKLRIAPGSFLPYPAALLVLISAIGYLISWQVTGSQYRFCTFLDSAFPPLGTAGWLQFGAMVLLALLTLFAAKRSLPLLAIPALLYSVGTLLLTLDSSEKNYPLLVIGLIFFWFFVVTSFSVFHSKWPLCVVEGLALVAIVFFCIKGDTPFVKQDTVMGTCYDLSLLMQLCGYYGGMLVLSLAISKKFNMETITATTRKDEPKEMAEQPERLEEADGREMPVDAAGEGEKSEGEPVPEIVETVRENVSEPEAQNASEPVPTVPVSGSRLQKVLKEDIVYDRDQRLMYKKKVNIFSVLGLILSALTVLLGIIITFELVNTPVLKNDAIGLPMLAMGLFMACIFGTRVTYKEYYTKTVVTERKVVREESNWEEVLASRLEEDEQSIAALTENYARMTELYGKLLENTSELMNHIDQISAIQSKLELGTTSEEMPEAQPEIEEDRPSACKAQPETEEDRPGAWEAQPETEEDRPGAWEAQPEIEEDRPSAYKAQPETEEDRPGAWEAQPESEPSVQEFADFEDQVVFDPEFLKEQNLAGAFAEEETALEPEAQPPLPESEVEAPIGEAVTEETPSENELEVPKTAEEIAESDTLVSKAEERRRRLQEKLQEIYRRNQELQKAEAEQPEEW